VSSCIPRRRFHLSAAQFAARKPKHANIKASDAEQLLKNLKSSDFQSYTEEEKARLPEEYSEAQIAAIEAGEAAINPEDMAKQFSLRDDPWSFQYLDDFSTIEPVVDHHIRAPESNTDPNWRLKEEDEIVDDLAEYIMKMPDDPTTADWLRFTDNMRLTVGKEESERNPRSSLVPDLFEPGETLDTIGSDARARKASGKPEEETSAALLRLMQVTGYSRSEIMSLRVKSLVNHAVVNQTRLGKVRKTYVLSIAGNGKGLLGIGEGKSEEPTEARTQSQYRAIRNMQPILRYEQRTIYGDVKGKVGAVELQLMTRPPGMFVFSIFFQFFIYFLFFNF
jgi:small subunit ribosomal protein S5